MKNKYRQIRNGLKKMWRKEYILWGIVIMWSILFWEGYRILPWAKRLSEAIPIWAVILNLAFLIVFTTLLINKREFSKIGVIVTLVGCLLSWIIVNIGYKRFPLLSIIVVGAVILFNLGFVKFGGKEKKRQKSGTSKRIGEE